MRNTVIMRGIILGAIALAGIVAMQSYWVISTWNVNEEEFNQKVSLALNRVAKGLAELNGAVLPSREIVKQRTSNYYIVNIEYEIDTNILQYYLQKEFESLALNIDFEYAVYDCHTDEMVYVNYCSYSPEISNNIELGNLPKDTENQFNYYFGVKFPTRPGYLLGKMQLSIFFSVTLLVMVFFFAYAMAVILRQKRLSEMQKDFINNMTHEFKTPISTIRISTDVFLNSPEIRTNPRLLRYAGIIQEQNQRLNTQVEKVLQLARVEGASFELKMENLELNTLIREVADNVSFRVEDGGGKLSVQYSAQPLQIRADRLHLTNVLHNLLDNAIKYCREKPLIDIRITPQETSILLEIADQGIGIRKEEQGQVFQKFYRVSTGNLHNVKGFGLGLYYVKNVCSAHGWRVMLHSEPGKGTTISIKIPARNG